MTLAIATRIVAGSAGEDRAAHWQRDESQILAIADGAGGSGAGGLAAETVIALVQQASVEDDPAELLRVIDRTLSGAGHGGETTAVIAIVREGLIVGASVGDSGAWLISGVAVQDLTRDQHTKPLLGSGQAKPICFQSPLFGRLVMGSNGLFKYVPRETIVRLAGSGDLEAGADALVEAARLPSGGLQDDITVLIAGDSELI